MKPLVFEKAQLTARNFGHENPRFKQFGIVLGQSQAREMRAQGWNVKKDPEDRQKEYLVVNVNAHMKFEAVKINSSGYAKELPLEDIYELDHLDLDSSEVVVVGEPWWIAGKSGIMAYLKSIVAKEC